MSLAISLFRVLSLGLILFVATPSCFAQSSDMEVKLDSVLSAWNGADRPGMAVAYFEDGKTVISKGYGLSNLEHGIAWTTDTVSDLGSVSKQFIGFAMVLLEEKGMLSLQDDIRKHLPELPMFETPITIDDLIYHRSGLREIYNTLAMVNWRSGDGIFQEHAQTLVRHQTELQFPAGSRYLYNNTEYMLLADIVEVVSGMEFHDWMRENIFEPLDMLDTTIMVRQGQVIPRAATSYSRDREGEWNQVYDNSTIQGAGGIYSTVEDLGRWIQNFSTHKVGTEATVQALVTQGFLTNGEEIDYARGIVVSDMGGALSWGHSGASAGYRSLLVYLPEHNRGFVVLTNTPLANNPTNGLAQIFFAGVVETLDDGVSSSVPEEVESRLEKPESFVGTYLSDELQVFYEVVEQNGDLVLAHRWLSRFSLIHRGDDRFEMQPGGGTISFNRNDSGSIAGFIWDDGRTIGVEFRSYE